MARFKMVDNKLVQLTPAEETFRDKEEADVAATPRPVPQANLAEVWTALKDKGLIKDTDLPSNRRAPV